jgi:exodeoxyribonuclease VII large subunit
MEEKKISTVTEITRQIKLSLEQRFPRVWLEGEISNCKHHTSGHLYFTLKDEGAQISAVMWRSRVASLLVRPEDGMKVIARGAVTVYPPRGNYQIDVDQLQPQGVGELQLAFERLKQKLSAEGLFDPDRKKPLPEFPERIGIITSETGAALQDIRSVLSRRFPSLEVVLRPAKVQGIGAAEDVVRAIEEMNRYGRIDVLIIGRGGGSLEDLWAFNEEAVARAIAASEIPTISAVGHEVDFSIADFVADLRAPTPSAAGELVVRDRTELLEVIRNICYTMRTTLEDRVAASREQVGTILASYSFNKPFDLLRQNAQRVDELERSLVKTIVHRMQSATQRTVAAQNQLKALSPDRVLKRGYTMVRKAGRIVSHSGGLTAGDSAVIHFHDGEVPTTVK